MAQGHALAHFETFARLHRASIADLRRIEAFSERLGSGAGMDAVWWKEAVCRDSCYALIATEGQLVVGLGVLEHAASTPEAKLVYLCVLPDARGRGIGQLLVQTLVGRARSEGAAVVRACESGQTGIGKALLRSGFAQLGGGTWCFGLWDAHVATSYGALAIPEHEPVTADQAPAQCVLLAMGALDRSMLLTRRARQVIEHELRLEEAPDDAAALALAAARRGFFAWTGEAVAQALQRRQAPEIAERVVAEKDRLTPERVLGHLSRGHLCLLRIALRRLSGDTPTWYIVDGFDGYLFRVHDATALHDAREPAVITAAELRVVIGGVGPGDAVVLGKPL